MVAAGIGDVLIATQVTGEVRQEALVALNRRARVMVQRPIRCTMPVASAGWRPPPAWCCRC